LVGKLAIATALVCVALVTLFLLPVPDFVAGTFLATATMILAALWVSGVPKLAAPSPRAIGLGALSAATLYAVFYAGNAAIGVAGIPGLGPSSESSIYSLISNPDNPLFLQVLLLAFDAVGYESFFRGTLMGALRPRLGLASAPVVAILDAGLHLATLNPLWVATTFIADLVWGLTYYFGKGTQASITSHFLWDLAIFVIRPIA
jgi:membrane protease YdiL (CAAX protease family)